VIYIFNGPPGSGKDDACKWLVETGNFSHLSFKNQLIKETLKYFSVSGDWFMEGYNDRDMKETPMPQLTVNGVELSRRQALIYVSEDYIKLKHGKHFFGSCLASEICEGVDYCVSDGGFIEELRPIINKIGTDQIVLVQLYRNGFDFSNDSRRYLNTNLLTEIVLGNKSNPITEQTIVTDLDIDMVQIHNNGSLEEFKTAIQNLHEKVSNVREKNKRTTGRKETNTIRESL